MPAHNEILIRFLRRAANGNARMNPATDDTLKIVKLGENSVRCLYTEKSGGDRICDSMIFTYQQLLVYLYRVFFLLGLDEDPFKSVQFFIPGYPTILVEVTMLQRNLPQIMEILTATCWTWPSQWRSTTHRATDNNTTATD